MARRHNNRNEKRQKIDQHEIRPLQDKLDAITEIVTPKNKKELKFFLGHYNTFRNT